MRRFLILCSLFLLAFPVGLSISGCTTNVAAYCNGAGYGQKTGTVAAINLEPKTTGISLAYGQTSQVSSPSATDCKGSSASVSTYTYGTTNLNLVDVSPSGAICAGSWNRTSPGGIQDYTICTPPANPGIAYLTASANGVTSNSVAVYIHPSVTSISIPTQTSCISQGKTLAQPLTAGTVAYSGSTLLDNKYLGTISYNPVDPTIVTIDQNGVATAHLPGSTLIAATVSGTSATAGYFYTCPPATIKLQYSGGGTNATINPGAPQNLVATIVDINGNVINGLSLDYVSTNPNNISVSESGVVTANFPGNASLTAICQPTNCNPSPINQLGVFGNGKPIVSNAAQATATGRVSTFVWVASTNSQTFVQLDLRTNTIGSTVRMPYLPNSMVADQAANNLYFGSYRELMIYNATSNTLSKEDTNVPGTVLAVSPDNSTVLINDQVRQVFYLYAPSTGNYSTFGGTGTRAAFTQDNKTLYIVGPNKLYVHNLFTGWSTYDLSGSGGGTDVAITVPSVAAYSAGNISTVANGFCADTANGQYYPQADVVPTPTERLAATNDGKHILGALSNPPTLSDIAVAIPIGACPANGGLTISHTLNQAVIPGISPTAINQVVASPNSALAFVTYNTNSTTAGAALPYYLLPATSGTLGTLGQITLVGGATDPTVGVFSPDNTLFFVGTAGDNLLHFIDTATLTDTAQINPKLVDNTGKPVAVQFIAVKPRPTT